MTTASVTPAVQAAAKQAREQLVTLAIADTSSPLHGSDRKSRLQGQQASSLLTPPAEAALLDASSHLRMRTKAAAGTSTKRDIVSSLSALADVAVAGLAGLAQLPHAEDDRIVVSAARTMACTLTSTSSSVVSQDETLIRMAARPFHVVPPHQHVPSC